MCGRGAKAVSLADVPVEAAVDYACERADIAGQLAPLLRDRLEQEQLDEVYDTLEMPLIPVLAEVERAGVRIDGPALAAQSQRIEQELARRTERSSRSPAASSTSTRPSSSRRSCSTSCSCPS